jgi:hypothetical protein
MAFALVMALDQFGVNVGAALAGLGIARIAIGFAAQDSVANVISGFLIFLDKPLQAGDWVDVVDHQGRVVEITLRLNPHTPAKQYLRRHTQQDDHRPGLGEPLQARRSARISPSA